MNELDDCDLKKERMLIKPREKGMRSPDDSDETTRKRMR